MGRFLRKFFLFSTLIILGLLLLSVGIVSVFEQPIGRRVIAEVNKQLKTELTVQGFDLSVIRSFPNAAVNLQEVVVNDTQGAPLLQAHEMSFRFSLLSLLSSKVQVKSVVISDGALQIFIDREGHPNYDIFVETEEEATTDGPTISLEDAFLRHIDLRYQDASTKQDIVAEVAEAHFAGEFSSTYYTLRSEAELYIGQVDLDGMRLFVGQPFSYQARVAIDNEAGKYDLQDVMVSLGDMRVRATGTIADRGDNTAYDLRLASNEGSVKALLTLLPGEYRQRLGELDSEGDFRLEGTVVGEYGPKTNPEIHVDIDFSNGRLSSPTMDGDIRDVEFTATFTNGRARSDRSTVVDLQRFVGDFEGERFDMRLRVEDLEQPYVDFYLNGAVPMGIVRGFLGIDGIEESQGKLAIDELAVKGRYADMRRAGGISRVHTSGALVFDDAGLTIKNQEVMLERGRVRLDNNAVLVEDVHFVGAGTELEFTGSAYNVLPVLLADSLNSQRAELEFQANLTGRSLDIDRLLMLADPTEQEVQAAAAAGQADSLAAVQVRNRQVFTQFLHGTFNATIDAYNYNQIEGRNFAGVLKFSNNEMTIEGRTEAMKGSFLLDGRVHFEEAPYLKAKLVCNNVDITEMFWQANNFDQQVLTARNISGSLDARMVINAYFDTLGNLLYDKLEVLAGVAIRDGILQDVEMLEGFSTFVNIKDLRNIQFTNLQNYLEIRNQRLYLPVMFIQSNAVNMTISGEHTFDQDIAYHIKVNAGQVIADRFRRHDPTLTAKPARRDGFFNLYYAITGNIENYEVKSAKRQVKQDFERSEMRRREVQAALEREFAARIDLIEEPLDWRDVPEYPADPNAEGNEYLDFELQGGKAKKSLN